MNISVIGTGYVGLVTGACLAELGMNVICMDTDKTKIDNLMMGNIPIYEPLLEPLVNKNITGGRLKFTFILEEAVKNSNVIFIAVNTPTVNNEPDLKHVFKAARDIASYMKDYKVIVIKSTVPVGTGQLVKKEIKGILERHNKDIRFDIVSNPEFLREGTAVNDFMKPDRIVIGTESEKAEKIMRQIYSFYESLDIPIIATNVETSEIIKYACNTFLAAKVSFINEIANICELCGANVSIVSKAMGLDERIGPKFLNPGPGYGGSCLPKDTKAFLSIGRKLGYVPKIVKSVIEVNNSQIKRTVKKIEKSIGCLRNKTVTVLGVAFKADTDDIRESPSIKIIKMLVKKKANVNVTDPKALNNMKTLYPKLRVQYFDDAYTACSQSDCIVLATEWDVYKDLDFSYVKSLVGNPLLIDLKNIYEPDCLRSLGFLYIGMGRN